MSLWSNDETFKYRKIFAKLKLVLIWVLWHEISWFKISFSLPCWRKVVTTPTQYFFLNNDDVKKKKTRKNTLSNMAIHSYRV